MLGTFVLLHPLPVLVALVAVLRHGLEPSGRQELLLADHWLWVAHEFLDVPLKSEGIVNGDHLVIKWSLPRGPREWTSVPRRAQSRLARAPPLMDRTCSGRRPFGFRGDLLASFGSDR